MINEENNNSETNIKVINLKDLPIVDFDAFIQSYAHCTMEEIAEKIRSGKLGVAEASEYD